MRKIFDKILSIDKDKIVYFTTCVLLAGVTSATLTHFVAPITAAIIGCGSTVIIGLLKEIYDKITKYAFNTKDLIADLIGAIVGAGIIIIPFI